MNDVGKVVRAYMYIQGVQQGFANLKWSSNGIHNIPQLKLVNLSGTFSLYNKHKWVRYECSH